MAFRDSTRDFNRSRPERRHASRSSSPRSFRSSNQNARANYNLPRVRDAMKEEERSRETKEMQEREFLRLQQLRRAIIRLKNDRSKSIDKLLVSVYLMPGPEWEENGEKNSIDFGTVDMFDPLSVIQSYKAEDLEEISRNIGDIQQLETNQCRLTYWKYVKMLVNSRMEHNKVGQFSRGLKVVAGEVQRILAPKSFEQLEQLEAQIQKKLKSNVPLDTDYWVDLLNSLKSYKAIAYLKKTFNEELQIRKNRLDNEEWDKAFSDAKKLSNMKDREEKLYIVPIDPKPILRAQAIPRGIQPEEQADYEKELNDHVNIVKSSTYIPISIPTQKQKPTLPKNSNLINEDEFSIANRARLEREYLQSDDAEEQEMLGDYVEGQTRVVNENGVTLKKPHYFNRVLLGFEWNSYNQAHFNEAHPPPKAVQGYRFNVFYPDLIGTGRAPTYRIERTRRKNKSDTTDLQDDVCIIRFIAGEPYQDIAFSIVDKDWDYSAKRDHGFKSSFDNGVLSLHFRFKKLHHRR
ncbi:Cactin [Schizosaccharomyces pombe]